MQIINWQKIETVLLDMDGTLLDLNFDNHFWQEHVPLRYAELHNISVEQSKSLLFPKFRSAEGTLDWYCIDYWSSELGLDIPKLKKEVASTVIGDKCAYQESGNKNATDSTGGSF